MLICNISRQQYNVLQCIVVVRSSSVVRCFLFPATRLPEFLKRPEGVSVPLGEDAKFNVSVDGEPKPEVKWYEYLNN